MPHWRTLLLLLIVPALLAAKPSRRRSPVGGGKPIITVPPPQTDERGRTGRRGVTEADRMLAGGRTQQAAQAFAREVQLNPQSSASWLGWGTAQAKLGKCSDALEKLWPFTYTLPFKAQTALLAARCSSRLGYADDAVYFDTLAAQRKPSSVSVRSALAVDLDRAGDFVGRDIILEQLLLMDRDRDASWYAEAAVALRHGDLDTFDTIDSLWRRDGRDDDEFVRLRAISWLDVGDPARANAEMYVKRQIRRPSGDRLLIIESVRRLGRAADALKEMDRRGVGRLVGADADVIRARIFVDLGRMDEAKALLDEWQATPDEEVAASCWYYARAAKDRAAMSEAEVEWQTLRSSPIRTLEQLVPYETK